MRHFTHQDTRRGDLLYEDQPTRVVADRDVEARDRSRSMMIEHRPWSPAQLVAIVAGIIFLVIGGIALARTGVGGSTMTSTHVTVAGAGQTQLMAYLELIFGALLLAAGSIPGAGRGGMTFLGLISLVFGIIVAAQPSSFYHGLGIGSGYGIFLIVVGIILVVAAIVAPVYWGMDRRWGSSRRRMVR
jgi:uncharacterized membrane protein HdeD (DUF308 family)